MPTSPVCIRESRMDSSEVSGAEMGNSAHDRWARESAVKRWDRAGLRKRQFPAGNEIDSGGE